MYLHIPLIQFCLIKFESTTLSLVLAARLDRDLFMKTYWYNFLPSCPRFMSNLFIFISEMRRCAAELTIFVLCLRLSGAPAPAAGICRFAAETKTVLCSNMTSLRGLSDTRPGTDLERLEIHNSQGGFTIDAHLEFYDPLWIISSAKVENYLIHFILEHQKLLRYTAVQCGNKRNRNTRQWNYIWQLKNTRYDKSH